MPLDECTVVSTDGASGVCWLGRVTQPEKLDLSTDRGDAFKVWKERWEDHLLLSGIGAMEPRRQMAALRACLSDDTLRIVRNMELEEANKNDISVVLQRLEEHAIGQVNEVLERKRFNSRVQAEGETFDDVVTSLRDLSRSCNFCRSCNESIIRATIVIGLRCADTVQKLCAVPKLSLASAISVCRAQEAASRDAREIRSSGISARRVGAADRWSDDLPPGSSCRVCSQGAGGRPLTSRNRQPGEADGSPPPACLYCGRQRLHRREDCPALRAECHRCGRFGHFAAVCRAPQVADRRPRSRSAVTAPDKAVMGTQGRRLQPSSLRHHQEERRGSQCSLARAELHRCLHSLIRSPTSPSVGRTSWLRWVGLPEPFVHQLDTLGSLTGKSSSLSEYCRYACHSGTSQWKRTSTSSRASEDFCSPG